MKYLITTTMALALLLTGCETPQGKRFAVETAALVAATYVLDKAPSEEDRAIKKAEIAEVIVVLRDYANSESPPLVSVLRLGLREVVPDRSHWSILVERLVTYYEITNQDPDVPDRAVALRNTLNALADGLEIAIE